MPREENDPRYWLELADEDLLSAEILKRENGPPMNTIYNYHQAAEKALKALIVSTGNQFPFIHDLGELLKLFGEYGGKNIEEAVPHVLAIQYRYRQLRYPRGDRMVKEDVEAAANAFRNLCSVLGINLKNLSREGVN
jgi:HEPN domain-containing protein